MQDTTLRAYDEVQERVSTIKERVLDVFREGGPMTDEKLYLWYAARHGSYSEGSVRSRRAELVKAGVLYDTGKRERNSTGCEAIVWGLRDATQAS